MSEHLKIYHPLVIVMIAMVIVMINNFIRRVSPYQVLAYQISPRLLNSTTYHGNYLIYLSYRSSIVRTYSP